MKLIVMLTIALVPIGAVAVFQTVAVVEDASELGRRDILSRTEHAANAEYSMIRRAFGAGEALGAVASELGPDSPDCSAAFRRFVTTSETFVFAGFVEADGRMRCVSEGEGIDFSDSAVWQQFASAPSRRVAASAQGRVTGLSVLIVTSPVLDTDGMLLGAVSVSVPHIHAELLMDETRDDVALALSSADGTILSASAGLDDAETLDDLGLAPSDLPGGTEGATRALRTDDGDRIVAAIVPLSGIDLFVVGLWPQENLSLSFSLLGTTTPVFPVVMWIASLFVAIFAVNRLVLRPLTLLSGRMTQFSLDQRVPSYARLEGAPGEIRQIARTYNAMIDRIAADHDRLEATIEEKEILLKEVHHRVKNNLQLIASILNMQLRGTKSAEARRAMQRVQDRVMSLATIHKALYTGETVDAVRVDALIAEVVAGVFRVALPPGAGVATATRLEPTTLDPDQAVPLTLLATEGVTNACKYVGRPDGGRARIEVTLSESDSGDVDLTIWNTSGGSIRPDDASEGTGLGSNLIEAFASQLGGTLEIDAGEDGYKIRVRFRKLAPKSVQA